MNNAFKAAGLLVLLAVVGGTAVLLTNLHNRQQAAADQPAAGYDAPAQPVPPVASRTAARTATKTVPVELPPPDPPTLPPPVAVEQPPKQPVAEAPARQQVVVHQMPLPPPDESNKLKSQNLDEQSDPPIRLPQDFIKPPSVLSNEAPGLKLPSAEMEVESKKRYVVISAAAVNQVSWLVFSKSGAEYIPFPALNTIFLFPNDVDEKITIYAMASVDKQVSVAKMTVTIRKSGDRPPPPPPPGGEEPPKTRKAHVTIVIDPAVKGNAQLTALIDVQLRQHAEKLGVGYWVYNKGNDVLDKKGLAEFVAEVGSFPVLLVQDEAGNVTVHTRLPMTLEQASAVIAKGLGR